jgi:hypothetical protein
MAMASVSVIMTMANVSVIIRMTRMMRTHPSWRIG